jgi:prophage regulatory protein
MLKTSAGDTIGTSAPRQRRFLRVGKVLEITGLKPSTLYAMMAAGTFPKSIPLGPRARAWLETEIEAWIEARIAARDGGAR